MYMYVFLYREWKLAEGMETRRFCVYACSLAELASGLVIHYFSIEHWYTGRGHLYSAHVPPEP